LGGGSEGGEEAETKKNPFAKKKSPGPETKGETSSGGVKTTKKREEEERGSKTSRKKSEGDFVTFGIVEESGSGGRKNGEHEERGGKLKLQ